MCRAYIYFMTKNDLALLQIVHIDSSQVYRCVSTLVLLCKNEECYVLFAENKVLCDMQNYGSPLVPYYIHTKYLLSGARNKKILAPPLIIWRPKFKLSRAPTYYLAPPLIISRPTYYMAPLIIRSIYSISGDI